MKEKMKQIGMDFSLWCMNVNFKISDAIDPYQQSDLVNCIYNIVETISLSLFSFFYEGSKNEFNDAIDLAFGDELDHYNIVQQAVIIANGILENNKE